MGVIDDGKKVARPYTVNVYKNSKKEPFGLTIRGKGKKYIDAHASVKFLVEKGKDIVNAQGIQSRTQLPIWDIFDIFR